jgi:hypothetical protein
MNLKKPQNGFTYYFSRVPRQMEHHILQPLLEQLQGAKNRQDIEFRRHNDTIIISKQEPEDTIVTGSIRGIGESVNKITGAALFVAENQYRPVNDPVALQRAEQLSKNKTVKRLTKRRINQAIAQSLNLDPPPTVWQRLKGRLGL